jgi:predicted O-methyltransferase YrrM
MNVTVMKDGLRRRLRNIFQKNQPSSPPSVARLGEPFAGMLLSMHQGEAQIGEGGATFPIDAVTRISTEQGMWIHDFCRLTRPEATLEIGLAYGFSVVYFLAAIRANGHGSHSAIDPLQRELWHNIGRERARLLGMADSFKFFEKTAVEALTEFAREGKQFDMIFVDGDHRFENALFDFTLSTAVCKPGGHILLDDWWMPAIKKVVGFIRANRDDFTEVPTPLSNVVLFQKTGEDTRTWQHFADF